MKQAYERGLPQLGGGLLWLYRIAWCALSVGAVSASVLSIWTVPHPTVLALRLVKSAVLIGVAAILLYRRPRDPVAALLGLAFLAWTITSSFDFTSRAELLALLDRLRFLLFALALLLFPDGRWNARWAGIVAGASGAVFLLGVCEALRLFPTHLFLPLAIPCVIAAIASLVCRFQTSRDYLLKQQLKWIALGLVAGVSLILCARTGAALPNARTVTTAIVWEAMFQIGIVSVAVGFLVSLLRFRLFDAETVISRSAAYAILTVAVVAIFGGTEALIQNIGQNYLGMNVGGVSGGMAAAVAALLLSPLHEKIASWAEDRFQPDLALLKRTIPELLARLGSSCSTRDLGNALLPHISAAIHATRSALLLDGQIVAADGVTTREAQGWDPASESGDLGEAMFPLHLPIDTANGATASILLGPRPDGTFYGREDLDAVRSIFPALQQVLIATKHREALDAAMERRERRLRTELENIAARLRALEGERLRW